MSTPKLPNTSYDTHDTARLAFLLKLVDTLHSMTDAFAIEDVACRMLADNLPVDFAWFAEIGPDRQHITIRSEFTRDRSVHLAGVYPVERLQSLARTIEAEQAYIIDDVFQSFNIEDPERTFYESHRIRSCLAFPVGKGKQALTCIAIADDTPHRWTAREVSLVHETAVRTGDAIRLAGPGGPRRKEVLRKSEQRLSLALTSAKIGACDPTSITAYGQLLQKQSEEVQDERASLMQKLNSQVSRLQKLIRDLLDTTRLAEGKPDQMPARSECPDQGKD